MMRYEIAAVPARKVTSPVLHTNGTGADTLQEQLSAAHNAGIKFQKALGEASPHPRDYYLKAGAYAKALDEHTKRMSAIRNVLLDLVKIWQEIDNQATDEWLGE